MGLHKKTILLTCIIIGVEIASFLFTYFSLKELATNNAHIAEDYELHLRNRKIRTRVVMYHDASISYWLRKSKENLKAKEEYKARILEILSEDIPLQHATEVKELMNELEPRIISFLEDSERFRSADEFLNDSYMERYREITEDLESLVYISSEILLKESKKNQIFYRSTIISSIAILMTAMIVLLLGIYFFGKLIIKPVLSMIDVIENMRRGDFSERIPIRQNDEIGRMGETINSMSDELAQVRKERVEFIGSIVHDLGNPLSYISLKCELAEKKSATLTAPEALKAICSIKEKVETLKRLTQDLLEAAKENTPALTLKPTRFCLKDLVENAVAELKEQKPEHSFAVEGEDRLKIMADKHRITQVVQNLLSNGVKYSPPGSLITAKVFKHSHQTVVEIIDEGSGIPDNKKESIFQAFSRLDINKNMAAGSGLGLAIVKNIVTAHGGEISVQDNHPKGSIFRVTLPIDRSS